MASNNPGSGFFSVAEFQVSSIPWVTSSTASGIKSHDFPFMTRFITIKNTAGSGDLKLSFTLNGMSTSNHFVVSAGSSLTADLRLRRLFISGSDTTYSLLAGMTNIQARQFPHLTGSVSASDGVTVIDGIG